MNDLTLIPVAYAQEGTHTGATAETAAAPAHEGLKVDPAVVAFQALNFVILLVLLQKILYKPILKLLMDREKRIADGVKNAEKADMMLKESNLVRQDMIKTANVESQSMLEKARKEGESLKNTMLGDAHTEADKIMKSGQAIMEMEKSKAAQELKAMAVNMVVAATEKVLRSKMDEELDSKMIEESLKSYSS